MASDDQERFEDYLELERYIEELQAGKPAHPPKGLTPEQAHIYRMAAFFRSAAPGATAPRAEFVEELRQHLLDLEEEEQEEDTVKLPAVRTVIKPAQQTTLQPVVQSDSIPALPAEESEQAGIIPLPPVTQQNPAKKRPGVSRRTLLTGGAAAAASLAAGTGLGMAVGYNQAGGTIVDQQGTGNPAAQNWTPAHLLPKDGSVEWLAVTTLSRLQELGRDAFLFYTGTIVGYVILSDGDDGEVPGKVIAMSAACTHMGCIVQWNAGDRKYHCPCHNGVFTEYGKPSTGPGTTKYYTPLPRMDTVVIGDTVYVGVPKKKA